MKDEVVMLTIDQDGVAKLYDDTFDVIIHCQNQKDQNEVKRMLIAQRAKARWIESTGGAHYCSLCGWALMDDQGGNPPIMGIDFHRSNSERWTCCPGWNDWLMNYCPNCGARMNGGKTE